MHFTFHRIKNVSRTNGRNLNNRRHKKLTKKLSKGQTTSPKDETNFEKVLIEKMEQHNWTLLIACKICKKKKNAQSLMQTISNSFHMVGRMMNHVTLQITLTDLRFHVTSQISLIRFNFQKQSWKSKFRGTLLPYSKWSTKLWWHHFQRQPP